MNVPWPEILALAGRVLQELAELVRRRQPAPANEPEPPSESRRGSVEIG